MPFRSARFTTDVDVSIRQRFALASIDSPPFRFGETNSAAVAALQRALIDLEDRRIAIPDGPTGNYLAETRNAVITFQAREHLSVDGEAGKFTLQRLDAIFSSRIPTDPNLQLDIPPDIPIPQLPPRAAPLFLSNFEFVDVTDATLVLGRARIGKGRIQVRDLDTQNIFALDVLGIGVQPFSKSSLPDVEKIVGETLGIVVNRGNLGGLIKLVISPQDGAPRVGSILKNPANVVGELKLAHLTEGILVVFKGELGAVLPGITGSFVFFGMPFSILANGATIVPNPIGIVGLLLEGRLPLPNAVGLLGKTSTGIVGASISLSVARVVNASFVD